jgi:hypothetical protein
VAGYTDDESELVTSNENHLKWPTGAWKHCAHCYRAKSKAKGTFEHENHRYREFKQNTRSMQKGNRGTQVLVHMSA